MSTSPQRQSARRRPMRNAGEKSDDVRVSNSNERNLPKDAGNTVHGVDGNLSQGKDSSPGKNIVQEKDDIRKNALDCQQVNDRLVSRINGSNQAVRKGVSALSRAKSPVRSGKPSKISRTSKAIRIFVKWLVLLAIIGGFGWGMWNGVANRKPKYDVYLHDVAAEGRFAELEQFSRKTTKMLQVQLDLVDIKYEKEVKGLKKKLEESIQEQAAVLYTELLNLKEKTGNIEESLLKFSDSEVLTRDEVLGIVNNVMETRVDEGNGNILSLDDVRAVARRLVEAEIARHAADGLGRVDYALGSGGGRVVQHSEGYFPGNGKGWGVSSLNLFRKSVGGLHPYAARVLEPSFGEPGHCLPLIGSKVSVVIALRTSILAEAVTLEHVAKSNAYDRSSAPKQFRIFGWLGRVEGMSKEASQMFLLGEFTYDLKKSNAQTFDLPIETTGKLVNTIKLDVQSNHGSSSHTCIYRLRVHGKEPDVPRLAEVDA